MTYSAPRRGCFEDPLTDPPLAWLSWKMRAWQWAHAVRHDTRKKRHSFVADNESLADVNHVETWSIVGARHAPGAKKEGWWSDASHITLYSTLLRFPWRKLERCARGRLLRSQVRIGSGGVHGLTAVDAVLNNKKAAVHRRIVSIDHFAEGEACGLAMWRDWMMKPWFVLFFPSAVDFFRFTRECGVPRIVLINKYTFTGP